MPAISVGTRMIPAHAGELLHHLVQAVRGLRDPHLQQRGQQVADVVGELGHPHHVVHHVAEVRRERRRARARAAPGSGRCPGAAASRTGGAARPHASAGTAVPGCSASSASAVVLGEDQVLGLVDEVLEPLDRGQVPVDHLVDQHVHGEPAPTAARAGAPTGASSRRTGSTGRTEASRGSPHPRARAARSRSPRRPRSTRTGRSTMNA